MLGDFNCLLDISDKINFGHRFQVGLDELSSVFENNGLEDLEYSGAHYTWSNNQNGRDRVACKLDKIASNSSWCSLFSDAKAWFATPGLSDHSPGLLCCDPGVAVKSYPFKFHNY